jgi:hypothetical protein
MLDFVPFAGSGWKMAYGNRQSRFITEFLQFNFLQPCPGAITAPAVRGNEQLFRFGINFAAHHYPPLADGGHR